MTHDYGEFNQLLYEACFCGEAVDHFDLNSNEPAHQDAWKWLLNEQRESALALVRYVQEHAEAIILAIGDPPDTVPVEPPAKLLRRIDLGKARFAFLCRYAIEAEQAAKLIDGG